MSKEQEQRFYVEQLADRAVKLAGAVARSNGIRDIEECESVALERLHVGVTKYNGPSDIEHVWRWAQTCIRNAILNLRRRPPVCAQTYCAVRHESSGLLALAPEEWVQITKDLPRNGPAVLRLRLEGWSPEEIGQRLRLAPKTVQNTIYACLRILRARSGNNAGSCVT